MLIRITILKTLIIFLTGTFPALAASTGTQIQDTSNACARYLAKISAQSENALRSEEELMNAVNVDMVEAGISFSQEEKSTIFTAFRLQPLFDSRIAQRAISAELSSMNIKKPAQGEAYLLAFGALSTEDQLRFVDGVIEKMNRVLPEKLTSDNLSDAMKLSKSLGMKFSDFSEIFKKWSILRTHRSEDIKLAILIKLLEGASDLLDQVKHQKSFWQRVRRAIIADPLYRQGLENPKWSTGILPLEVQQLIENIERYPETGPTTNAYELIFSNYTSKLGENEFTALVLAAVHEGTRYPEVEETYALFKVIAKYVMEKRLDSEQLKAIKYEMLKESNRWPYTVDSDNVHILIMGLK